MLKFAVALAFLISESEGAVPTKCLKPAIETVTGVERGEQVSIDDVVSEVADNDTHFFGLQACSELVWVDDEDNPGQKKKVTGRLVSVQFYLKNDKTGELIPMDTVGPTLDPE